MGQELLTEGSELEEAGESQGLGRSALRLLRRLCVLLVVFAIVGVVWSLFAGDRREASVSLYGEDCTGHDIPVFVSVDHPPAPFGRLSGWAEAPDGWEELLADGSVTVQGRLRGGSFHGPDGLVVESLQNGLIDCALQD